MSALKKSSLRKKLGDFLHDSSGAAHLVAQLKMLHADEQNNFDSQFQNVCEQVFMPELPPTIWESPCLEYGIWGDGEGVGKGKI